MHPFIVLLSNNINGALFCKHKDFIVSGHTFTYALCIPINEINMHSRMYTWVSWPLVV